MAVTKSWATQPAFIAVSQTPKARGGFVALLCASVFVAGGLLVLLGISLVSADGWWLQRLRR
jgi:hypothetical protein